MRAPTHQYHPQHLLDYQDSSWHAGSLGDVISRFRRTLPPNLSDGFRILWQGARVDEDRAIEVVRWIEANGRCEGFRVPSAQERARATGQGGYLTSLGLTTRQLYDAVGNHFDPEPVAIRMADLVHDWFRGCPTAHHACASPNQIRDIYSCLTHGVSVAGIPVEDSPFPRDVQAMLTALEADDTLRRGNAREGTATDTEAENWKKKSM